MVVSEFEVERLPPQPHFQIGGISVRLCWRDGRVSIGGGFEPDTTVIAYPAADGQVRVFRPTGQTDAAGRRVFFEEPE